MNKEVLKARSRSRDQVDFDSDRGSVEAGLVLIPTTLLFLMILQIVLAGSIQITERAKLHDVVIKSSLSPNSASAVISPDPQDTSRNLTKRTEGALASNSKIEINHQETQVGRLHRIEIITPIPIFEGLFSFLGISELGTKNVAVFIEN